MSNPQQLIVFTRYPEPGSAKTRLISHLGAEGAAQLQRGMTEHTVRQARRTGVPIEIRYTGGSEALMREWLGDDLAYAGQGEGDLGERMQRAFEDHFSAGADRVVIAGSDCPSNSGNNMEEAFARLGLSDVVVGPAADGGYYLLGLSAKQPQLFERIDWGGGRVLEQTKGAAEGLSVHLLPELRDVDFPEDIPPRISVIIPSLNEETFLPGTLERARDSFNVEVIVVDGGSTDGTKTIVPEALECRSGRAAQQNLGAAHATGEMLLFLHADTLLPDGWDWTVRRTLADDSVAVGAFTFKVSDPFFGRTYIESTANRRSMVWQLPFGDQGFFMKRSVFDQLGGFQDLPIMEDYAFIRSARRLGRIVTVPEVAVTSGRRWQQHGVLKVTLVNKLMILGYHLGIAPEKLARIYRGSRDDRTVKKPLREPCARRG